MLEKKNDYSSNIPPLSQPTPKSIQLKCGGNNKPIDDMFTRHHKRSLTQVYGANRI